MSGKRRAGSRLINTSHCRGIAYVVNKAVLTPQRKTITSRKANYRMNRINYKESELCSAISWEGSKDVSETWRHKGICHKKRIGCLMYFVYGSVLLVALLNPRPRTLSENQPYPTHFLSSLTCHVISLSST